MADPIVNTLRVKLEAERAHLAETLAPLSPDEMTRPYPGGWSIKDILAHLALAERLNVRFARAMLEYDRPAQAEYLASEFPDYPGPFALDDFNAHTATQFQALPLDKVLADLTQVRAETMAWVETLTPDQLDRGGSHAAWGETTVRGMLRILSLHDKMHAQDIARRSAGQARPRA